MAQEFKRLRVWRLTDDVAMLTPDKVDLLCAALNNKLAREPGELELSTFGFLPPIDPEGDLAEVVGNSVIIRSQLAIKDIPSKVIARELTNKIKAIESEQMRKVYKKERDQLKDEIVQKFLPRAFVKRTIVTVLIVGPYIMVDNMAVKRGEEVLAALREVLGSLPVRPLAVKIRPAQCLTELAQGKIKTDCWYVGDRMTAQGRHEESDVYIGRDIDMESDEAELILANRDVVQLGVVWKGKGASDGVGMRLREDLGVMAIRWPEDLDNQLADNLGEDGDSRTYYRALYDILDKLLLSIIQDIVTLFGGEEFAAPKPPKRGSAGESKPAAAPQPEVEDDIEDLI
ncbi:exonuclease recombination-associated [Pseudomonas phage PspYZU01]|uniref:Recombination-associated protein n=1 Tax=Pseudomonas phage PspYZU01 TaxID=1983555 RepID=A0A2U7NLM7_9CAUD|nr:exonuclease recombination-associated [Pseudomonas phage PspYZU01]ASD51898.1 recombination-associated protein [Pseudomonas phage PspYZU01]